MPPSCRINLILQTTILINGPPPVTCHWMNPNRTPRPDSAVNFGRFGTYIVTDTWQLQCTASASDLRGDEDGHLLSSAAGPRKWRERLADLDGWCRPTSRRLDSLLILSI